MLPFSRAQFLELFVSYNEAVWPAQLAGYAAGIVALWAVAGVGRSHGRMALASLAAMWLWTGFVYHIAFFARINPVALPFGLLFVLQGAALAMLAVRGRYRFRLSRDGRTAAGVLLVVYATLIYPLIGVLAHGASALPMLGITPCPVTLFTLGLFLFSEPRIPAWLWLAPLSWSLIGGSAAFILSVPQDWPLLIAGIAALAIAFRPSGACRAPVPLSAATPQSSQGGSHETPAHWI